MVKKDFITEKHLMFSFPEEKRFSFLVAREVKREMERLQVLRDMKITFNMKAIHFVDSEGFDFLVGMVREAESCHYEFEMIHILPEVVELIRLLHLEEVLGTGPDTLKSCVD
jgi:anti-anti-sigma regulatory factor